MTESSDLPGLPADYVDYVLTPLAVTVTRGTPRQTGFERRGDDPRARLLVAVVLCGAGKCERELMRVYAAGPGTVDIRTLDQERHPIVTPALGRAHRTRWMRERRVPLSALEGWPLCSACDRHGYRRIEGVELRRAIVRFGGRARGPEILLAVPGELPGEDQP
jgi:hypothetical protein